MQWNKRKLDEENDDTSFMRQNDDSSDLDLFGNIIQAKTPDEF